MLLSSHVNITNPKKWGYCYLESISSFAELCDEVIVVDGGSTDGSLQEIYALPYKNIKIVHMPWNDKEWSWEQLGRSMNYGLMNCQGDFCFRFDADYVFYTDGIKRLRGFLEEYQTKEQSPIAIDVFKMNLTIVKYRLLKARMPFIINKKDYPDLRYGIDTTGRDTDFMFAIMNARQREDGMWEGTTILDQEALIMPTDCEIWCYDDCFMTKEQIKGRKEQAKKAHIRYNGGDPDKIKDDIAYEEFEKFKEFISRRMLTYKMEKLNLEDHPPVMRDKVANVAEDMLGFNCFNWVDEKDFMIIDYKFINIKK